MPPQTRWIGGVRALHWPSQGEPRGALLFVPGNPGVCEYYTEFLSHLHAHLRGRCVIVCKGSPGHDETRQAPPPTGRYAWHGRTWTYYGLLDQVASQRLALEELRAELPAGAPVVLAGHSMGAYVATRLLCEYADDVQGMQLLFPTISHIGQAPQARITRLLMAPPLLFVVHWLVVCLACLPAYWHYMLVRTLTQQPAAASWTTSSFLRRPNAVVTALRTYADEEVLITDIPDELRQVLQRRKIPVRAYWGRGDTAQGDMVDGPLPTLPRQWASLGASHAPRDDVPIDSPRVAAALNTFASFVSESRQLYISAQASGRRVNVFLGRGKLMQSLSFDDVPGSQHARLKGVSSVALGLEAPGSNNLLLVASFGSIVAIWRLDALNMAKMGQVPIYARWRLDGTLPMRGQLVSTLCVVDGRLAIGSNTHVTIWAKGAHASSQWRTAWSTRVPRPMLRVRWSPDGQYLAAVPLNDTRVLVWHVGAVPNPTVKLIAKLRQTRPVQAIRWRHPQEGHEPVPLLVVTTWNHVAHVYTVIADEPLALRQWASIDAASDVRDVSASDAPDVSRVVALMYADAGRLALALQHDLALLEMQEQRVLTGVTPDTSEAAERRATRRRQLEQYLAQGADLFLALMGDGSMAAYVLMNIDKRSPTLSQTFLSLKVPPCVSTELIQPPLMLEFMPFAPLRQAPSSVVPTALIHGQTASGLRGMMAVSLALLLDGDPGGLFVQDTIMGPDMDDAPLRTHAQPFLRAEHRSDIVSLHVAHPGRALLSFSRDGVLIWWELCDTGQVALHSKHQLRLRDAFATCALGHSASVAVLCPGALIVALLGTDAWADSSSASLPLHGVSTQCFDLPAIEPEQVAAFECVPVHDAYHLHLVLRDGRLHTWSVHKDGGWHVQPEGWHTLSSSLEGAALVPHWRPGRCAALLAMTREGDLQVWADEPLARALSWPTHLTHVQWMRASAHGHLAVVHGQGTAWSVSVYDSRLADVCDPLVHRVDVQAQHRPHLAWTAMDQVGSVLAISVDNRVDLVAQADSTWALLGQVLLEELGGSAISRVEWMDGHRLLVSSTCQLFLYDAKLRADDTWVDLLAVMIERSQMRPYYDPMHLSMCLQMGLHENVAASCSQIAAARTRHHWPPITWSWERAPLTDAPQVQPEWAEVQAQLAQGDAWTGPPGIEAQPLAHVLRAVQEVYSTPVDEAGRQCLAAWYASGGRHVRWVWAHLSRDQATLHSKIAAAWDARLTWERVKSTGIFAWMRERAVLVPLMEQVARAAFASGDDIDPVLSTLLYLALGKHTMVRSVWRRAIGHSDQGKMQAFLAHDFSSERWRVAAQKNAFALMSQRRFLFAAAFFLLGGALQDAVNVCVRQLHDLDLAIAVARVYEEEDHGPVFLRLVEQHVVSHALATGDRWLGAWALLVLDKPRDFVQMLTRPLYTLAAGTQAPEPGWDWPDPCLLLVLEHCKATVPWLDTTWTREDETGYVLNTVYRLERLACDLVSVALLRTWRFARPPVEEPVVPTTSHTPDRGPKIGSLMGERRPPPAQSTAELDLSAFGW
ncbi:regulator of (H+)-ATPase in vacuolar membrane [Malassezia caprae]|uniref:Regulator of (H+)-ATPase in vacuolar membrane n=1 Tax=Malassezia caprae TaxID=1381934 RepID=A0AAF0IYD9_9BASI|nr:regulator of (H+)-ATPase in vacuolar membrane [Malassezia caprae]